ncbi:uncharacterized protein Dana_GF21718 [Drosophila ananassae]|uniref:Reticulon-like protein n=1 Tax=Drosophila ananassae TaxID=7217 RepID=B3N0H9_DROAN|nr:uncharacterized protein Dana_GF21718 [Drosophila ananassae]
MENSQNVDNQDNQDNIEGPANVEDAENVAGSSSEAGTTSVEIYTFSELYQKVAAIELPSFLKDLIYWRDVAFSVFWFRFGFLAIGIVFNLSILKLLGLTCLVFLGHFICYGIVREVIQFRPYEELLAQPEFLTLNPEVVQRMALGVTNCINRWMATFKHIFLGGHLFDRLLVLLLLVEFRGVFTLISLEAFVKIVYCLVFILPRFFEEATYRLYRYYLEDEPTDTPLFWILTIILMAKDFVVQILRTGRLEIRSLQEEGDHFHQIPQNMFAGPPQGIRDN